MGGAMLSKSLIQFSVNGQGCVPSLLFGLGPNYGGGNEDNGDLLQKLPCTHCCTQCHQPCSRPPLTHTSTGDSCILTGKSGSVFGGGHCSFLLGPGVYKSLFVSSRVLCKFWQVYGGVNGDLIQEGLCHTQVYCTQRPCPCRSPLLTRPSAGDTQTQFWLSFCGISESWCAQHLFEPSEHLWRYGFDYKCDFAPPTMLLGLLLCPWT